MAQRLGGCGVLLKSQPYESGLDLDAALTAGRVLPWSAGTLPAAMCVLGRLGWASPGRLGGARGERRRLACRSFVLHMVDNLLAGTTLRLRMDEAFIFEPHPKPQCHENEFAIVIEGGGAMRWPERPGDVSAILWERWTSQADGAQFHFVGDFIGHTMAHPDGLFLFKQVCRGVGRSIDHLLVQSASGDASSAVGDYMRVIPGATANASSSDVILESRIMKHVLATRRACDGDLLHFSFASDSARVGSLGILAAVGCLPSNVAFAMAPQVARVYGAGPAHKPEIRRPTSEF